MARLVDTDELEDEVCQTGDIQDDDTPCADLVLVSGEIGGGEEYQDGDGYGSDSQVQLCITIAGDNDDELYREPKEKEEVEFQQRDVYLHRVSIKHIAPQRYHNILLT